MKTLYFPDSLSLDELLALELEREEGIKEEPLVDEGINKPNANSSTMYGWIVGGVQYEGQSVKDCMMLCRWDSWDDMYDLKQIKNRVGGNSFLPALKQEFLGQIQSLYAIERSRCGKV